MFKLIQFYSEQKEDEQPPPLGDCYLMDVVTLQNHVDAHKIFDDLFAYFRCKVEQAGLGWKLFEQWDDPNDRSQVTNLWLIPDQNSVQTVIERLKDDSIYAENIPKCVQREKQNLLRRLNVIPSPDPPRTNRNFIVRQDFPVQNWDQAALRSFRKWVADYQAQDWQLVTSAVFLTGRPGALLNIWDAGDGKRLGEAPSYWKLNATLKDSRGKSLLDGGTESIQRRIDRSRWPECTSQERRTPEDKK